MRETTTPSELFSSPPRRRRRPRRPPAAASAPSLAVFFPALLLLLLGNAATVAEGCTNLIVTPGASEDGATAMLGYNTDDNELFGMLFHYPARDETSSLSSSSAATAATAANSSSSFSSSSSSSRRKVYSWETGVYLGTIPEVPITHNVIGNCNDRGLCIAETSFVGTPVLKEINPDSIVDYGSLMYLALQRSGNAREAIEIMTGLTDTYGYASKNGESYSVVDSNEAWIMDMIGKGKDELGAVWVAVRIPDGTVSAHANHARITTFPRDDPDNCLYASDVVSFARRMGLYDGKDDEDFSFSGAYDAIPPHSLRYAEARVWDILSSITDDADFAAKYLDYAKGSDPRNPMPLYVTPKRPVSLDDVRERMGSHYEGTSLYFGDGVGSGVFDMPYRPRPYTWTFDGDLYVNERTIGVEKTGINFIAQIRSDMPPPLMALMWFGVDDASTSPRCPVYAGSTRVSASLEGLGTHQGRVRPIMEFDMTKSFWVQNMVSNLVYSRWRDAYPVLKSKLDDVHSNFVEQVKETDRRALELYRNNGTEAEGEVARSSVDAAVEEITKFSVDSADDLHVQWTDFYGYMFVRYRDFVTVEEDASNLACGCRTTQVGMTDTWRDRIVHETGRQFWVPYDDDEEGVRGGGEGDDAVVAEAAVGVVIALLVVGVGLLLLTRSSLKRGGGNLERVLSMLPHQQQPCEEEPREEEPRGEGPHEGQTLLAK